jgi:peptide/nickel transport system substrate-binding protein
MCHPKRLAPAALAVSMLLLAASCGGGDEPVTSAKPPTPVRGGTVVLGSISDVDNWNEYLSREAFANTVQRRIFLRLARERQTDPASPPSYEPELAESWSRSDDGLAITFVLRDAVWSDGAPITAEDVRFTWIAQTHPDVAWAGAGTKTFITDVEIVDPKTAVFRFDRSYPYQVADAVDGGILPKHVFGAVPFESWRTHDWSTARIASGPFLLEEYLPDEEIRLVRNPRYDAAPAPYVDAAVIRVVPDAANLLTQLLTGGVDYMENVPPRDAARVRSAESTSLIAFSYPRYDYIGWNATRPPFDDPEVRRALTLAIDRLALVEDLLYGFGEVSSGPWPSFRWGVNPDIDPWPYDPDEARRRLADLGFRPGEDGVLERDGVRLAFTLTTNAGNRVREDVLVKVQEQLRRIGVAVDLLPMEMGSFVQANVKGEFDAYVAGWAFPGKIELKSLFASDAAYPNGFNVVAYRSEEVDRMIERLGEADSYDTLEPILHDIQRRIHEDQPYTFLFEAERLAGLSRRLHGVRIESPADPLAFLESAWLSPR